MLAQLRLSQDTEKKRREKTNSTQKKSAKVFDVKAQFHASDRKILKVLLWLDIFAYLKIWKNWPKTK